MLRRMARLVFGLVLVVLGFVGAAAVRRAAATRPTAMKGVPQVPLPPAAAVLVIPVVLGLLLAGSASFQVVNEGNIGVKLCVGRVKGTVRPGVHIVAPWCTVETLSARTRLYVMVARSTEGQSSGDDSLGIEASDNVRLNADVTIQYRVDPAKIVNIYKTIGTDPEPLVRNISRTSARDAAASFRAEEIIGSRRSEVAARAKDLLAPRLAAVGMILEDVLFREVRPSDDAFAKAIADKAASRQRAEAKEFEQQAAERDAAIARIKAEGDAAANQLRTQTLTPQVLCQQFIEAIKESKPSVVNTAGPCGGVTVGGQTIVQVPAGGK